MTVFTSPTFTLACSSGSVKQSGTRFPYQTATQPAWPFNHTSYYNIGLGSNAAWSGPSSSDPVTANLLAAGPFSISGRSGGITSQDITWSNPVYTGHSTDPLYSCSQGAYGPFGSQSFSMHRPSGAVPTNDTDVIFCLFDQTNNIYSQWNNNTNISTSSPPPGFSGTISGGLGGMWHTDGNGYPFAGQANSLPGIQGADLDNGFINHVLPCHMVNAVLRGWDPNSTTYGSAEFNCVWPAVGSDYQTTSYAGTSSNGVPFGSLLGIPLSTNISTLGLTAGGLLMANQLQKYGLLVCNRSVGMGIMGGWDMETTSARVNTLTQMSNSLSTLSPLLRVLKSWMTGQANLAHPVNGSLPSGYQFDPIYNSAAPVNGGGTYPLAAPYWDSSLSSTFTSQNTY